MNPGLVLDLALLEYAQALDLMRGLVMARQADACPEVIILAEHQPVITLGRRGGQGDILVDPEELSRRGVALYQVERGGLATCHGPGQVVLYPIVNLAHLGLKVTQMVDYLQETACEAVAGLGLTPELRPGHPGIWVGEVKVASLGLHVSRGVTSHGLSLNYGPLDTHFGLINPCGLSAGSVGSLSDLLADPPDSVALRGSLRDGLASRLDLDLAPWDLAVAQALARKYFDQAELGSPQDVCLV